MTNKAVFIDKKFTELTKDEFKSMVRCAYPKRITPQEMCDYYTVTPEEYSSYVRSNGLVITKEERANWLKWKEIETKKSEKDHNNNKLAWNPKEVSDIPKFLVCALYDVPLDYNNGSFHYDLVAFQEAKEDIQRKIDLYESKLSNPDKKEELSKIKPIDLYAMRIYRGIDRKDFSKKSGLTLSEIKEVESRGAVITLAIEREYKRTLNIKNHHVIQLRKVMTGKSDTVIDDREIPKLVKLKVWVRDKGQCTKCSSKGKLHYHHKIHFSEGGEHTEENLTLLCVPCHAEEHKGERVYHMLRSEAEKG
jgi:hypothetical protein